MEVFEQEVIKVHLNITPFELSQGIDKMKDVIRTRLAQIGIDETALIVAGFNGSEAKLQRKLQSQEDPKRKIPFACKFTELSEDQNEPIEDADIGGDGVSALLMYDEKNLDDPSPNLYRARRGSIRDALVAIIYFTCKDEPLAVKGDILQKLAESKESIAQELVHAWSEFEMPLNISVSQFVTFLFDFVLSKMMQEDSSLKTPAVLLAYLQSKRGKGELIKKMTKMNNEKDMELVEQLQKRFTTNS